MSGMHQEAISGLSLYQKGILCPAVLETSLAVGAGLASLAM